MGAASLILGIMAACIVIVCFAHVNCALSHLRKFERMSNGMEAQMPAWVFAVLRILFSLCFIGVGSLISLFFKDHFTGSIFGSGSVFWMVVLIAISSFASCVLFISRKSRKRVDERTKNNQEMLASLYIIQRFDQADVAKAFASLREA